MPTPSRARSRSRSASGAGRSGRGQAKHPLVTACLITKDEEESLPACLTAAKRIADDVVVYDTGSTDGTVAIARRFGAQVIEGYWDDDFGRARNAALAVCRGDWILWVDADETFECDDPKALRQLLRNTKPEVDAWSVPIWNLTGAGVGAGFTHRAARLFRRTRCEWVGRLHEQVTRRNTKVGITQGLLEIGRIRHTGYLDVTMVARQKTIRNMKVAEREVAEADGWERGHSLTSLGRSCLTAGRCEEAIEHCSAALDHTDNLITRRLAMRTCAEAHLLLNQVDEAEAWIERATEEGTTQVQATVLRARVATARHAYADALALLDRVQPGTGDEDGFAVTEAILAPLRVEALVGLERWGEAADVLLGALTADGILDTHLGAVVDYLDRAGRPLSELSRAIPAAKSELFLAQVRQLQAATADRVLTSLLDEGSVRLLAVLATAAGVAPDLPVERALPWAARMRQAGLVDACPLSKQANDPGRQPIDQARAAAVGWRVFADEALRHRFLALYSGAESHDQAQILAEANALCPELVGRLPDGRIMAAAEPVSIVVPCLNHASDTLRLLRSVVAHTAPDTYQVVLVDRGSTDAGSVLHGDPENLALVVLEAGWGADRASALSVGVAAARYELVVLLDQQSEVLPGWLPPLVAAAHDTAVDAVVLPQLIGRGGEPVPAKPVAGGGLHLPCLFTSVSGALSRLRSPDALPPQMELSQIQVPSSVVMVVSGEPETTGEKSPQVAGAARR